MLRKYCNFTKSHMYEYNIVLKKKNSVSQWRFIIYIRCMFVGTSRSEVKREFIKNTKDFLRDILINIVMLFNIYRRKLFVHLLMYVHTYQRNTQVEEEETVCL
jgi:hypothetical protein